MGVMIYGAGMAGLLAANILRRHQPIVRERQDSLPDNHGALLRFRTPAVELETGQRFRMVDVTKAIKSNQLLSTECSLRDANRYSYKVTGRVSSRSIINLAPCVRYIAPPDFLKTLARDVSIWTSEELTLERLIEHKENGDHVISTIPMPDLMRIVGWDVQIHYAWRPIWSTTILLDSAVDIHQTIYYPGSESYYRVSVTGQQMIVESMTGPITNQEFDNILYDFGLEYIEWVGGGTKRQEYGKLIPIDEDVRQQFLLHMTDEYRVYSIGRFGTWRQILLDDVVQDIKKVSRWIEQRTGYHRRLES